MKEESEKLKHGAGKMEAAFGAAKKNLLDDLLSVQELVAEKTHSFGKVIESEILPNLEGMVGNTSSGWRRAWEGDPSFVWTQDHLPFVYAITDTYVWINRWPSSILA